METLTDWPCVMVTGLGVRASVVVLAVKVTLVQFFTRFAAFNVPSPVARSYPAVFVQAAWEVLFGFTRTPSTDEFVLLQLGEPPAQATELFVLTVPFAELFMS